VAVDLHQLVVDPASDHQQRRGREVVAGVLRLVVGAGAGGVAVDGDGGVRDEVLRGGQLGELARADLLVLRG
jgi:hypothetical protein